jgi:hypothetical protein
MKGITKKNETGNGIFINACNTMSENTTPK